MDGGRLLCEPLLYSPLLQNLTLSLRFAPAKMLILLSPPQRGEIGLASSTPPATRQLPGVRWPFVVPPARRIRLRRTGRSPPAKGGDGRRATASANHQRLRLAARSLSTLSPPQWGEIGRAALSPPQLANVCDWQRGRCRRYLPPLRGRKQLLGLGQKPKS